MRSLHLLLSPLMVNLTLHLRFVNSTCCYLVTRDPKTSDSLWDELCVAGEHEHDRFWRMPLDDEFGPQIWSSNADLCNVRSF